MTVIWTTRGLCIQDARSFLLLVSLFACFKACVSASKSVRAWLPVCMPFCHPVLPHKAGQEGRGEILLENSFMR